MNDIDTVDRIKKSLNSRDSNKKEIALYTLLHHKGAKDIYWDEIVTCTGSSNDKVRLVAIMVLSSMKSKSIVPILEQALNDKLFKIRAIAAISLAKYKDEKAIPELKAILRRDISDHSIHKRAIEALGKYKNDDLLNIFEEMLSHRRKASKLKAIDALGKIHSEKALEILIRSEKKQTDGDLLLKIQGIIQNFNLKNSDNVN